MRLRIRLLLLVLASLWRKPMGVLEESVLNLRVLPNDIDVTAIVNDRLVALMDLGRMDIVFRMMWFKSMFKRISVDLSTFATVRFRYGAPATKRIRHGTGADTSEVRHRERSSSYPHLRHGRPRGTGRRLAQRPVYRSTS